ncbi:putative GATA transcription factor [Taphrina deformans PYCC 5710]|uniref:GATA transcription factor n=1 Tax=Taphrina deformans (strain PYCC 5710 / ATCC 11124 / CBS 356.35 / IMI 108563 / JCM 9778 / NBRC 8474) TaxID=1097556 RepID=R4XCP8_TAPDE|nr:putative GATA transcription factor [Taphrina deformans PYCC 5710]|eukprot:CCG81080.1 putative GATA transcription factor [Taphrina deformans PYCC 5710]
MTEKLNATLKVYYLFNETKCLARGGTVAATPIAPGADVATIDLRTCALAVCSSSPELIGDKSIDYSLYTLDATEGIENDLYEGQGLLSWGLSQPARLAKVVTGFVKPSLSGTVLEVRMKLSQVVQSSQQDFITAMQSFERISRTLPATFDYSNWNEFMKHTTGNTLQAPNANSNSSGPVAQTSRNGHIAQVNTLQKARELAGRQNPQSMSAQLKTARQQQSSQQRHARMIAQQAAATQATNNHNFIQTQQSQQKRVTSTESDGTPGGPASPPLPTPSSPPQMKIFAPPPTAIARSNSLPMHSAGEPVNSLPSLTKFTSLECADITNESGMRGTKRKASELSTGNNRAPTRGVNFSPAKAINAAKNNIGAIQQLFKAKSPGNTMPGPNTTVLDKLQELNDSTTPGVLSMPRPPLVKEDSAISASSTLPGPNLKTLQRNDAELLRALEDGQPIKFCYNCGNIQTRGNWRQLEVHGKKHNLCNACGVYWKTKHRMRPEKLWDRNRSVGDQSKVEFPTAIPVDSRGKIGEPSSAPLTSEPDRYGPTPARTSPARPIERQAMQQLTRATRSSPAPVSSASQKLRFAALGSQARPGAGDGRPRTPTRETLHELHINTPPAMPSPSPASGNGIEDLVALLQTPKKSFSSKIMSSPSPWRSMFTLLDDAQKDGPQSPSRYKLDKLLEDLGMTNGTGANQFDFNTIANFSLSPNANNNIDSLASFMSSPPGMGVFTSSAGMENDNSTPEDLSLPLSAHKNGGGLMATPKKSTIKQQQEHFEEGDSLFTPKRYQTRSQPTSVKRDVVRSAGTSCGEEVFGGAL